MFIVFGWYGFFMEDKNEDIDRSKKLEDSLERLITITGEVRDNINKAGSSSEKLVFLIKELNNNTKRHNKILIGLSFMLLALTLIEATLLLKPNSLVGISLIGILFLAFWLIGGALMVLEGFAWLFERRGHRLT